MKAPYKAADLEDANALISILRRDLEERGRIIRQLEQGIPAVGLEVLRHVDAVCAGLKQVVRQRNAYEEALRSIAANTCCETCREASLVAQKALEE